ncbi:methylated-DNA--[protein]-cysteine S-methyltransferase [Hymenobacter taeanensis]|uniref:Methylated-DNA--protein-cysteine methyltransferase n=1 Tax=Hymenobacter taeanensis TaxID=2735321 RepID=A0A6M6BEW6_9BACT|nr:MULTISPECIES: methylated-DNA--[protein]-cysteine S-methyltransferase [Hymenobacter]QJX46509.1 methylated-DNA--[protein]-cysteine S-methyltransferase [Hymenobacter taeanensis]UOQ80371.1 methylated-DNA--[protein]-cysteine S-methyltransferase [Hymenobacter sp. 5414T-23]
MSEVSACLSSPLGLLEIRGSDAGLTTIRFVDEPAIGLHETRKEAVPQCLLEGYCQLQAYFNRELQHFSLSYAITQGTEFQRNVWAVLAQVEFGRTASYLDLARLLQNPGAVRAVGAANGQNPLAIVWPCHRIIGASGQLTGYAGGLARKRWLLAFERPATQGELFAL